MKLKTVLQNESGSYDFEGEFNEEQVTFLVTVALNVLLARGVQLPGVEPQAKEVSDGS